MWVGHKRSTNEVVKYLGLCPVSLTNVRLGSKGDSDEDSDDDSEDDDNEEAEASSKVCAPTSPADVISEGVLCQLLAEIENSFSICNHGISFFFRRIKLR